MDAHDNEPRPGDPSAEAPVATEPQAKPKPKSSPIILLAPVVMGFAMWMLFSEEDADAALNAPSPPELFSDHVDCNAQGSPAHHHGERREQTALASSERYPFAPGEGVRAVVAYSEAAACYAASNDALGARRAREHAAELQTRTIQDYRSARLRLDHALREQSYGDALEETELLLSLLQGRNDPYVEWLTNLERQLRLAQSRSGDES
jgi:hypothetical protein